MHCDFQVAIIRFHLAGVNSCCEVNGKHLRHSRHVSLWWLTPLFVCIKLDHFSTFLSQPAHSFASGHRVDLLQLYRPGNFPKLWTQLHPKQANRSDPPGVIKGVSCFLKVLTREHRLGHQAPDLHILVWVQGHAA